MTSSTSILFNAAEAIVKQDNGLPLTPQEQTLLNNPQKIADVAEKVIEAQKPCLAVRTIYWTIDHPFTITFAIGAIALPCYAYLIYAIR